MNKTDLAVVANAEDKEVKNLQEKLRNIVATQNLHSQRRLLKTIATELNISMIDCAAALAYLSGHNRDTINLGLDNAARINLPSAKHPAQNHSSATVRLVRYRLNVGAQQQVLPEKLKQVLVEESGVDIKNIANVRIQDDYTLIDLPDEMPQEIFHHLRIVEINGHKLDIRRVKPRNKKRGSRKHRQTRMVNLVAACKITKDAALTPSESCVE